MIVKPTPIEGLVLIEPKVFADNRGYFFESFNANRLREQGIDTVFVQDNESLSQKNVLRGLHFQRPPYSQAKLVRVIKGAVLDVAVDIRRNSRTYGQSFIVELNEEDKKMLLIPEGFAHGFLTLRDNTIFSYKCSNYYNPQAEGGILWNDSTLNINWEVLDPILSDKDKNAIPFHKFESPF